MSANSRFFYVQVGCLGFHCAQAHRFLNEISWNLRKLSALTHVFLSKNRRYFEMKGTGEILSDGSIAFKCLCPWNLKSNPLQSFFDLKPKTLTIWRNSLGQICDQTGCVRRWQSSDRDGWKKDGQKARNKLKIASRMPASNRKLKSRLWLPKQFIIYCYRSSTNI